MSSHPRLSVHKVNDVPHIQVAAVDLREESLEAVSQELFRIADGLRGSQLVMDMAEVDFLTSTALGKLVALNTRMRAGGGRLVLANVPELIYEIFAVTSLDRLLDIQRATEDGLAHSASTPMTS
jgi:anti-sigma B factor antagonist